MLPSLQVTRAGDGPHDSPPWPMLKSLELAGFKSFADRTRLDFSAGVTAVVGPNGSGKSNVVDAIKWVLGTQSAKALRGGEMVDVIFNGSATRRAVNAAEVTLTLDNASGLFSLEAPEVALTRRVLRSGESEYLINRQPCRLKDIRELLAGTGVGTEAYSIIEQGKVDALLQASTHQRRAIFEEAAGISRFRGKRQEALRRLQRVDQNLLRLSDIVDEVETRLRSVRSQAGKAETYRQQTRRLEELRTALGMVDWSRLTRKLDETTGRLTAIEESENHQRQLVAQAEHHLPELEQQLEQLDHTLAAIASQLSSLREHELMNAVVGQQQHARTEALGERRALLQSEWRAFLARPATADDAFSSHHVELFTKRIVELRTHQAELTKSTQIEQRHCRSLRDQREAIAGRLAASRERYELQRGELSKASDKCNRYSTDLQTAREQLATIEAEQPALHARIAESEASVAKLREKQQRAAEVRTQLADAAASIEQTVDVARRDAQASETELARVEQRWEIISELDRQRSARGDQVSQFLRRVTGDDNGPSLTVAELLHVEIDMASMIEAALGEAANQVVLESLVGIDSLAEPAVAELPMRTTFARLDATVLPNRLDLVDLTGEPGVIGRADQFVDAQPQHETLVRRLLGRTWLVDSLATALALSDGVGQGLRFVSIAGEVVGEDGSLTIGPFESRWQLLGDGDQLGILQEELANTRAIAKHAAHDLAKTQQQFDECRAALAEAIKQCNLLAEQFSAAEQQLREAQRQLDQWHESHNEANAAVEMRVAQLANLTTRQQTLNDQLAEFAQQIEQVSATNGQLDDWLKASEQSLQALTQQRHETDVELVRVEQQLEAARRESQRAPVESKPYACDAPDAMVGIAQEIEVAQLASLRAESAIADAAWKREQLTIERSSIAAKRVAVRQRRQQIAAAVQETRKELEQQQLQKQSLQVAATRVEYERETLAERIFEDYGIDLATAATRLPASELQGDRADVECEIESLRKSINRIGAVNTDALDELNTIEERFAKISSQYKDLSQAKESLERLITRLNNDSRQLFFETIETVRGHFQELFRRLFGGGNADLVVEESTADDPLECGIEIQACPPGKDTRSISLLSGGERTLTCVALLLAMFRSKPSPFCVLDEVDAALDEANIGRFNKVISEFLSATQFIVITHSKKTMTGADTLYGITMQESGVSKQVSVRFDDVAEDGTIRRAA